MKYLSSIIAICLLAIPASLAKHNDATSLTFTTELLREEARQSSANSFEEAQEKPRERRKTVGQHLDRHISHVKAVPQNAKKGLNSAGKGLNNVGRALKRKGNNIGKAIQSRRRRDTVGQSLDKGIATVAHPVENAKKGLDSAGKGLDNAGKALRRKGENVGKAIESRRRRDTVGQSLDKSIANVEALPQNAIEGLDNAGKALRRKGENVGKAIESRRSRHTIGDKVNLAVL